MAVLGKLPPNLSYAKGRAVLILAILNIDTIWKSIYDWLAKPERRK